MEEIIKYKTSDSMEWDKREFAEKHDQLLNLKLKIKDLNKTIKEVNDNIRALQDNCEHEYTYEPPAIRYSTRSEYNGPDSDDSYGVQIVHTTHKCCICDKEWTVTRDV